MNFNCFCMLGNFANSFCPQKNRRRKININLLGMPESKQFGSRSGPIFVRPDIVSKLFAFFLASSDFCNLPITFANSLDPDKDQQNVGPDLNSNCLTLIVFLKDFPERGNLDKKSADDNKNFKITQHAKS